MWSMKLSTQSVHLVQKHGIVLGPDLNANGEMEGVIDRLTNADSATRSAQDPQTSQIGGDSMLGKTLTDISAPLWLCELLGHNLYH